MHIRIFVAWLVGRTQQIVVNGGEDVILLHCLYERTAGTRVSTLRRRCGARYGNDMLQKSLNVYKVNAHAEKCFGTDAPATSCLPGECGYLSNCIATDSMFIALGDKVTFAWWCCIHGWTWDVCLTYLVCVYGSSGVHGINNSHKKASLLFKRQLCMHTGKFKVKLDFLAVRLGGIALVTALTLCSRLVKPYTKGRKHVPPNGFDCLVWQANDCQATHGLDLVLHGTDSTNDVLSWGSDHERAPNIRMCVRVCTEMELMPQLPTWNAQKWHHTIQAHLGTIAHGINMWFYVRG